MRPLYFLEKKKKLAKKEISFECTNIKDFCHKDVAVS
jgi:hypothetical protein